MAKRSVIDFLRHARIRGPSGVSIHTDWMEVPEGFEPEQLVVGLHTSMGQSFVTTTIHVPCRAALRD
jgi:hypothetical protein